MTAIVTVGIALAKNVLLCMALMPQVDEIASEISELIMSRRFPSVLPVAAFAEGRYERRF